MKKTVPFFLFALLVFCAVSASAQIPPPAAAPDYFPESWKEFSYPEDKFRIRFPKAPAVTKNTDDSGSTTTYRHSSFLVLEIQVTEYQVNLEEVIPMKDILGKMRASALEAVNNMAPKIIKDSEVTSDGRPGMFMHLEAKNGEVVRLKAFVVKNRLYYMFASVKKGDKHGENWENDFEKVALGFLNSFKLI